MMALAKKSDDGLMNQLQSSNSVSAPQKPTISKKQQDIDDKIERLLLAYKKQDEVAHRKLTEMDKDKKQGKKNLMEKFGFSDDEEEDVVLSAAEIKKKALALP